MSKRIAYIEDGKAWTEDGLALRTKVNIELPKGDGLIRSALRAIGFIPKTYNAKRDGEKPPYKSNYKIRVRKDGDSYAETLESDNG